MVNPLAKKLQFLGQPSEPTTRSSGPKPTTVRKRKTLPERVAAARTFEAAFELVLAAGVKQRELTGVGELLSRPDCRANPGQVLASLVDSTKVSVSRTIPILGMLTFDQLIDYIEELHRLAQNQTPDQGPARFDCGLLALLGGGHDPAVVLKSLDPAVADRLALTLFTLEIGYLPMAYVTASAVTATAEHLRGLNTEQWEALVAGEKLEDRLLNKPGSSGKTFVKVVAGSLEVGDLYADDDLLWLARWSVANGAGAAARLRAAAKHGPGLLLTEGASTPHETDLDILWDHQDEIAAQLDRFQVWVANLLARDQPTDPRTPERVAELIVKYGRNRSPSVARAAIGHLPGWELPEHSVRALCRAGRLPTNENLGRFLTEQAAKFESSPPAFPPAFRTPSLETVVLCTPRLLQDLANPGTKAAGDSVALCIMRDHLASRTVDWDNFAALAPKWTGSFEDLVATVAAIE